MSIFNYTGLRRIADTSIILKLLLVYTLVIVIFLGGVDMVIILDVHNILKEKDLLMEDEYLDKLERAVLSKYNDLYNIAIDVHSRVGVAYMLSVMLSKPDLYWGMGYHERIAEYMDTLTFSDRDLLDVVLIPLKGDAVHSALRGSRSLRPRYDFHSDISISEWMKNDEFLQIHPDNPSRYLTSSSEGAITYFAKIFDPVSLPSRNAIGYLLLNLSPDLFYRELERSRLSRNGDYILLNQDSKVLFSSDLYLNTLVPFTGPDANLFKDSPDSAGEYMIRSRNLDEGNMTMVNIISLRKIKAPINRLLLKMVLLALFGFAVAVLIVFGLLRVSSRRFFILLSAFNRVREGQLDIRLPVPVRDEIGQLQEGFNDMCRDLGEYINRVYSAEICRKDMENKYLQAQINPHFLYNTLEHLQSRALGTGDVELVRMITLLGELFRWSSRSGESIVRIDDELEHVSAYLEIQKLRLGEQLKAEFAFDDDLLDYGIPKMVLQPLVENAITHGIGAKAGTGHILVSGRQERDRVEILISDDGDGMDEVSIVRHLCSDSDAVGIGGQNSIGIANVNQRISLLFGEEYTLRIKSEAGQGTTVTVRIPKLTLKEMRNHVQGYTGG